VFIPQLLITSLTLSSPAQHQSISISDSAFIQKILIQLHFFSWRLRFGDIDLSSTQDDEDFVQEFRITKITKHPKYVQEIAYFDIAVLELEPVEITAHVRPICLPSSKDFRMDKYDQVREKKKLSKFFSKVIYIWSMFGCY
jgi:hypothetical protein